MKWKLRSGSTVMRVGVGTPVSMCAVLALNSLQKSIDLTPRAPSAGPTGGVGAAFPAPIRRRYGCILMSATTEEKSRPDALQAERWPCLQPFTLGEGSKKSFNRRDLCRGLLTGCTS